MMGEVRFQQERYAEAIREFKRVMLGFGGDRSAPEIRPWQAKAGLETGRCNGLLASRANRGADRKRFIEEAKKYFRYVIEKHPESEAATAAEKQLQQIGSG
jgi:TolA-binding protein